MSDPGRAATPPTLPPAEAPPPEVAAERDWQALPLRARTMFSIAGVAGFLVPALVAFIPIGLFVRPTGLAAILAVLQLIALPGFGLWLARKQYRRTHWKLDGVGFSLRRGNLWRSETCVPTSRVQHLDIKRGPLERRFRLATLVVHTAGTRDSAVTVSGLDDDDAERLRDHLSRQLDDHDETDALDAQPGGTAGDAAGAAVDAVDDAAGGMAPAP